MTESISSTTQGPIGWRFDAPVFGPYPDIEETYPNGDKLPGIWITVPVEDDEGTVVGRRREMLYPSSISGLAPEDLHGDDALFYGSRYYDEAMGCTDPCEHDTRIECFRAAELLYRHAAGRENAAACLCLGYVYSYDRCEGRYWRDSTTSVAAVDCKRPYPREERAFECFYKAAEAGICEACYKLGDMYKHGMGCEPDTGEAFRWYVRSSELMDYEHPVILGSVALRLGECFEEGVCGSIDFNRAIVWYSRAVDCLSAAVDVGETWYAKALANARAGKRRCEQEVAL